MRIGSLCSGAGGLDMAVESVFGATTSWHCEIDPAASKVLAHRWPGVPNHRDLIDTDWASVEPVDIMCAGWPCQPFSSAGKRKGAADERAIWPHIAGAIRILRPRIVVLENVSAVVASPEFTRVADSLAQGGYEFSWTCLRASDVGAPHRRERLFVVAYAEHGTRHREWSRTESRKGNQAPTNPDSGRLTQRAQCDGEPERPELAAPLRRDSDRRGDDAVSPCDPALLVSATVRDHKGRNQRDDETCLTGALLPTPAAADGERGQDYARANREGSGGDDLVTAMVKESLDTCPGCPHSRHFGAECPSCCCVCAPERGNYPDLGQWGKYAPAIARWETINGPAPSPTEPNRNGNPRLNPAFSEWLMGWPAGWVTDVPGISRNEQLRIIGNGVVVRQAVAALRYLLSVSEAVA